MTARRGMVGELCFAAEGMAGTAAATSLRRLSSLMEAAPVGRLFGAITTLSDTSAKAARALEEGDAAMQSGDDHTAMLKFARALTHMDDLAGPAPAAAETSQPPRYLRKSR